MAYSDFNDLPSVLNQFELELIQEIPQLFTDAPPIQPSNLLSEILRRNATRVVLELRSEKEKSERIISPILAELQEISSTPINVFSGETFNVDKSKGLNGVCDFLISKSPISITIVKPVIVVVEAKKSDIAIGLPQCTAEMVAAHKFNKDMQPVFGVVTTATQWAFLSLRNNVVTIDPTIYLFPAVDKILGILMAMVTSTNDEA